MRTAFGFILGATLSLTAQTAWSATRFVNAAASGANTGVSWENAYTSLQSALQVAVAGDEIWVAAGTYVPGSSRSSTFQLVAGVAVYGGFAGGETERTQRDFRMHPTILSGDVLGDDEGVGNNGENVFHVLVGADGVVLDGFTVQGGTANENSNLDHLGGGILVSAGSMVVANCTFVHNSAVQGGAASIGPGSVKFANCLFLGNEATNGGAIFNFVSGSSFVNCVFSGNTSVGTGGAIQVVEIVPELIGCVLTQNYAGQLGGAIYVINLERGADEMETSGSAVQRRGATIGPPTRVDMTRVVNSIVWANSKPEIYASADAKQRLRFSHSDVGGSGGSANWDSESGTDDGHNIDADPRFVDSDGADGIAGTLDDNSRLLGDSPCFDFGRTSAMPVDFADLDQDGDITESLPVDLDGESRVFGPGLDLGPYESHEPRLVTSTRELHVREAGSASLGVSLTVDPGEELTVTVTAAEGDADLSIASGSSLHFNSENYSVPQLVRVAVQDDADLLVGSRELEVSAAGLASITVTALEVENDPAGGILYVRHSPGIRSRGEPRAAPRGDSWGEAFADLETALSMARHLPAVREIWVAEGHYFPSARSTSNDSRSASFRLIPGKALYGGFQGTETDKLQRNPASHLTVLDGDFFSNDGSSGNGDNAYHVVIGATNAAIDGFTIRAGNASGRSNLVGGGMLNIDVSPIVGHCVFVSNVAEVNGGAMSNTGYAQPIVTDCVFLQNAAESGGAVDNGVTASPRFERCVFSGNTAEELGGALFNHPPFFSSPAGPDIRNCVFVGNTARLGGAVYSSHLPVQISFSTFTRNSADGGSAAYHAGTPNAAWAHSILWNDLPSRAPSPEVENDGSQPTFTDCIVQASKGSGANWNPSVGNDGGRNLDADPRFVDSTDAAGADDIWGTQDDGLRLRASSPAVDRVTSGTVPPTDLSGVTRPTDSGSELGAYERGQVPPPGPVFPVTPVPAPATVVLLVLLLALASRARRRRRSD